MLRRALLLAAVSIAAAGPALAQRNRFIGLSEDEAALGVTEALRVAATLSTSRLGRTNGFFNDPAVRIPLPQQFVRVQRTLRAVGMSGLLDDLERGINRAAEQTMPEAGRMFLDVILNLTIGDAIDILAGGDHAATNYLRGRTSTRLTRLLTPPMRGALDTSGAFRLLDMAAGQIGMRREARGLRTDVTEFAVGKALDGAFYYIGKEEEAIRRDPLRRTSDILRRVYGA